jgi:hypothetical protein
MVIRKQHRSDNSDNKDINIYHIINKVKIQIDIIPTHYSPDVVIQATKYLYKAKYKQKMPPVIEEPLVFT